jgi:WD40 repeat protein
VPTDQSLLQGPSHEIWVHEPWDTGVLTTSWDSTVRIWNATTGGEIAMLKQGAPVRYAAFSPDGTRIATAAGTHVGQGSGAYIWNSANGKEITAFKRHMLAVLSAVFSPNGARVVTADALSARLWNVETGKQIALFDMNGSARKRTYSHAGQSRDRRDVHNSRHRSMIRNKRGRELRRPGKLRRM